MARENIVVCDRCGKRNLSEEKGTLVQAYIELPCVRVVAEDDTSYTEALDFCCQCAARFIMAQTQKMSQQERLELMNKVKK